MTSSGNEIIIEFKNFIRMDEGITDMIRTAMRLYASHYLAAAWLEPTTAKELCEGYRTSAAGYLNKIASALNQRSEFIVPEADYGQRNRDNLYTGIGCTGMDVLTTENPSGPDVILRDRYNNPLIYKP